MIPIDAGKRLAYLMRSYALGLEAQMSNKSDAQDDVIIVQTRRVSCDGGGGALGHPKVYMDMGQGNEVQCKYCDRVFKLDPESAHAH